MRLTPDGIKRLNDYITAIHDLKRRIIGQELKAGENVQRKQLALQQCDAAIAIVNDLLAHLPQQCPKNASWFTEKSYAAENALRLGQLMFHSRPGGSYPINYDVLNGGSGAWAVGIANPEGAMLASLTRDLTKDLNDELGTYFDFDKNQSGNIQLPMGISSQDPSIVLESALSQMNAAIDFWGNQLNRSTTRDGNYVLSILDTLNPNLLADTIERNDHVGRFMDVLGLAAFIPDAEEKAWFEELMSKMNSASSPEEKAALELDLKKKLIEFRRKLDPYKKAQPLSQKLQELTDLVLAIHSAGPEEEKNNFKHQLGLKLAELPCFSVQLKDAINTEEEQYIQFPDLSHLKRMSASTIPGRTMNALFEREPIIKEGFLAHSDENKVGTALNELIALLKQRISKHIEKYPNPQEIQIGKIKILQSLLNDLQKLEEFFIKLQKDPTLTPEDEREPHKRFRPFFTKLIKEIDERIHEHNQFVKENSTALGDTNDILQVCFAGALKILQSYTLGANAALVAEVKGLGNSSSLSSSGFFETRTKPMEQQANTPSNGSSPSPSSPRFFEAAPVTEEENGKGKEKEKENIVKRSTPSLSSSQ